MNMKQINWFGLAGGIAIIILIFATLVLATPWWRLTLGQEFGQANISPLSFSFNLLGTTLTIPLIWFLNLISLLSLIASATVILIYSVIPARTYSKHLLGFSYKKPLFTLIIFVVTIFIITYAIGVILQVGVPLMGSTTLTLPTTLTEGATITVPITTEFTWAFWLAIVATVLCIGARIYHKKATATAHPTPQAAPATTTASPSPA